MAKGNSKSKAKTVITGSDSEDILVAEASANQVKINGGDGNDHLTGTDAGDAFRAGDGDDVIIGGLGDDEIFGNGGFDTAVFAGDIRSYRFSFAKNAWTVTNTSAGILETDTLKHIEQFQFDNLTVNADGEDNAILTEADALVFDEDRVSASVNVLINDWDFERDGLNENVIFELQSVDHAGFRGAVNFNALSGEVNLTPDVGSYQYLAVGEIETHELFYVVSDGENNSTGKLTVTVTGANDGPVASADIAESEENTATTINVLLNDTDVDLSDTHTVDAASVAAGEGLVSVVNNQLVWEPGIDFDYLAVDEAATVLIDYTMSDNHGAESSGSVTLTVTGSNDALIIGEGGIVGAVTELDGDDSNASSIRHSQSGSIDFIDADLTDLHEVTIASESSFRGELIANIVKSADSETGSIEWQFFVEDADIDDLADGEIVTQEYVLTVDDNNGSTAEQTVTLTLTGSNDVTVIAGPLSSEVDQTAGVFSVDLLAGAVDVDGDELNVENLVQSSGRPLNIAAPGDISRPLPSLLLSDPDNSDTSETHLLTIDPEDFRDLAEGEVEVLSFEYLIVDGNGGAVAQSLTVTLTGTNDVPTVEQSLSSAVSEEDESYSINLLDYSEDVDNGAVLHAVNLSEAEGQRGWAIDGNVITIDPNYFDHLNDGEFGELNFSYQIEDEHGASVEQSLSITVEGFTDAPSLTVEINPGKNVNEVLLTVSSEPARDERVALSFLGLLGGAVVLDSRGDDVSAGLEDFSGTAEFTVVLPDAIDSDGDLQVTVTGIEADGTIIGENVRTIDLGFDISTSSKDLAFTARNESMWGSDIQATIEWHEYVPFIGGISQVWDPVEEAWLATDAAPWSSGKLEIINIDLDSDELIAQALLGPRQLLDDAQAVFDVASVAVDEAALQVFEDAQTAFDNAVIEADRIRDEAFDTAQNIFDDVVEAGDFVAQAAFAEAQSAFDAAFAVDEDYKEQLEQQLAVEQQKYADAAYHVSRIEASGPPPAFSAEFWEYRNYLSQKNGAQSAISEINYQLNNLEPIGDTAARAVFEEAQRVFDEAVRIGDTAAKAVFDTAQDVFDAAAAAGDAAAKAVFDAAQSVFNVAQGAINEARNAYNNTADWLKPGVKWILDAAEGVYGAALGVYNEAKTVYEAAVAAVSSGAQAILDEAERVYNEAQQAFVDAAQSVLDTAETVYNEAQALFFQLAQEALDTAQSIYDDAQQVVVDGAQAVLDGAKAAAETVRDGAVTVAQGILDTAEDAYQAVKDGIFNAAQGALNIAEGIYQDAVDTLNTVDFEAEVAVSAEMYGEVGLQIDLVLDSGSVDTDLEYAIETKAQYNATTDMLALTPVLTNIGGEGDSDYVAFSTISPNAKFYAAIVYNMGLDLEFFVDGELALAGQTVFDLSPESDGHLFTTTLSTNPPEPEFDSVEDQLLYAAEKEKLGLAEVEAGVIELVNFDSTALEPFEVPFIEKATENIVSIELAWPTVETEATEEVYRRSDFEEGGLITIDPEEITSAFLNMVNARIEFSDELKELAEDKGVDLPTLAESKDFGELLKTAATGLMTAVIDTLDGQSEETPIFVIDGTDETAGSLIHVNLFPDEVMTDTLQDDTATFGFYASYGESDSIAKVNIDLDQAVAVVVNKAAEAALAAVTAGATAPATQAIPDINPLDLSFGIDTLLKVFAVPKTTRDNIAKFLELEVNFQLMDVDFYQDMKVAQEFTLSVDDMLFNVTMEDGAVYQFSANEQGTLNIENASQHDLNGDGNIEYSFEVLPEAMFSNDTELGMGMGYVLDYFKGSLAAKAKLPLGDLFDIEGLDANIDLPMIDINLGPLLRVEGEIDLIDIDIFESRFAMEVGSDELSNSISIIDDVIEGDAGDNVLIGNQGNDILTGGEGADIFVFAEGDGNDRITDFSSDDLLDLAGQEIADISDLTISDDGFDTVIDFGEGDSVTLEGVVSSDLSNNDLILIA